MKNLPSRAEQSHYFRGAVILMWTYSPVFVHGELFMMTHEKLTPVVIFCDTVFKRAVYSDKS